MKVARAPRLAVWLLRRLTGNEPLIGDLVEEFRVRPSRWWFWYEVLYAVLVGARQTWPDVRPLKLSDAKAPLSRRMRPTVPCRPALRFIPGGGPAPRVGVAKLATFAALVVIVNPQIWWLAVYSILAGLVFGASLAVLRRRHGVKIAGNIFPRSDP